MTGSDSTSKAVALLTALANSPLVIYKIIWKQLLETPEMRSLDGLLCLWKIKFLYLVFFSTLKYVFGFKKNYQIGLETACNCKKWVLTDTVLIPFFSRMWLMTVAPRCTISWWIQKAGSDNLPRWSRFTDSSVNWGSGNSSSTLSRAIIFLKIKLEGRLK